MRIKYLNTKSMEFFNIPFSKTAFYNIVSFGLKTGSISKLTVSSN